MFTELFYKLATILALKCFSYARGEVAKFRVAGVRASRGRSSRQPGRSLEISRSEPNIDLGLEVGVRDMPNSAQVDVYFALRAKFGRANLTSPPAPESELLHPPPRGEVRRSKWRSSDFPTSPPNSRLRPRGEVREADGEVREAEGEVRDAEDEVRTSTRASRISTSGPRAEFGQSEVGVWSARVEVRQVENSGRTPTWVTRTSTCIGFLLVL